MWEGSTEVGLAVAYDGTFGVYVRDVNGAFLVRCGAKRATVKAAVAVTGPTHGVLRPTTNTTTATRMKHQLPGRCADPFVLRGVIRAQWYESITGSDPRQYGARLCLSKNNQKLNRACVPLGDVFLGRGPSVGPSESGAGRTPLI